MGPYDNHNASRTNLRPQWGFGIDPRLGAAALRPQNSTVPVPWITEPATDSRSYVTIISSLVMALATLYNAHVISL